MLGIPFTLGGLVLALLVYVWTGFKVGQARTRYDVPAPATTGAPEFERVFRAQQNTVEQMILFLPLLWLATILWGDVWGAAYALVWSVGRVVYVEGYARAAEKRSFGFLLSGGLSMGVLIAVLITFALKHVGH